MFPTCSWFHDAPSFFSVMLFKKVSEFSSWKRQPVSTKTVGFLWTVNFPVCPFFHDRRGAHNHLRKKISVSTWFSVICQCVSQLESLQLQAFLLVHTNLPLNWWRKRKGRGTVHLWVYPKWIGRAAEPALRYKMAYVSHTLLFLRIMYTDLRF